MICKELTVTNKIGFHARPASMMIQTAHKYDSRVLLSKGDQEANLESIISLLKMRIKYGDQIVLRTEGPDEAAVMGELSAMIESGFGED